MKIIILNLEYRYKIIDVHQKIQKYCEAKFMNKFKYIVFWRFGGINFFYFAIWTLIITFLPLWLNRVANLNASRAGIVFATMSIVAIILEPIYGIIQDK